MVQDKRKIGLAISLALLPLLLFTSWLLLSSNYEASWGAFSTLVFVEVVLISFAVGGVRIEFYEDHISVYSGLTKRSKANIKYSDVFIGRIRPDIYNPSFLMYIKGMTRVQGRTTIYWPSSSLSSPLQVFNVRVKPLGLSAHQWLAEKGVSHASPEMWPAEAIAWEGWSVSKAIRGKMKLKSNLSRFELLGSICWFLLGGIILVLSFLLAQFVIIIGLIAVISGPYFLWYSMYKSESESQVSENL